MNDIAGKLLNVGDLVVFNPPRYKGLAKAKVVGFTPKMVKVEYTRWKERLPDVTRTEPYNVAKI